MQKHCRRCNQSKDTNEFSKNVRMKDGLNFYCRSCLRENISKPGKTDKPFWTRMINTMRTNAAIRGRRGRLGASECSMKASDLKRQYQMQRGRCYYSGLTMVLHSNVSWKASPERIDTNKGYINGNVVLVCAEFNGHHQLTAKRLKDLIDSSDAPWVHSPNIGDVILGLKAEQQYRKGIRRLQKIPSGKWKCVKCKQERKRHELDGCDNCMAAAAAARVRKNTGRRNHTYLRSLYMAQSGRCYISNVPLELEPTPTLRSIETVDGTSKDVIVHPAFWICRKSSWTPAKFSFMKRLFHVRSQDYEPGKPIRRRYTRLLQTVLDDPSESE